LAGHPALGEDLDADFALSKVMVHWLTGTAAAAARLYYENAHATPPTEPTTIPIALAAFAGGFSGMRRFAERDHKNIVHWSTFEQAGHFAAHKAPDLLTGDLRAFFRSLR
jgi:epoxide hydrolase